MLKFKRPSGFSTTFTIAGLLATTLAAHATGLSAMTEPAPPPAAKQVTVASARPIDCLTAPNASDIKQIAVSPVAATTACAPIGQAGDQAATVQAPDQGGDDAATSGRDPSPAGEKFGVKATLYVTSDRSRGLDSLGCKVVPLRTIAVDGKVVKRHTVLFIKETVGLKMADGSLHDGYWYATDVGSAIKVGKVDLYTGKGVGTIKPLMHLNLKTLTATKVGRFAGCPTADGAELLPEA